jgi:hypothetical protein
MSDDPNNAPGAVPEWGTWRFGYLEIVRVRESERTVAEGIAGLQGTILAFSEEGYPVSYAFAFDGGGGENMSVLEEDLESTGRFARSEDFYDGTSVTVSEHGELIAYNEAPSRD